MKAFILYNPKSGKGNFHKYLPYLYSTLASCGYNNISTHCSISKEDFSNCIKKKKFDKKLKLLIIAGGDGSFNMAVNSMVIYNNKVDIFYIPCGTTNDIGFSLGFNKDIKKTIDSFKEQKLLKMNICKMNDCYFSYLCGIGTLSGISYDGKLFKYKKYLGKIYYFCKLMNIMFNIIKMNALIQVNSVALDGKYCLILALNTYNLAGFNIRKKIQSNIEDNFFEVVLVPSNLSLFKISTIFFPFLKLSKDIKVVHAKKVSIRLKRDEYINIDGEKKDSTNKIDIESVNKYIRVYCALDIK